MASNLTDLRIFQDAEVLAQNVWQVVEKWDQFARRAVGEQLVRSADSVGANIAESCGRYHYGDRIRFLYYARGSLYETRFWLRQAYQRNLISQKQTGELQTLLDRLPIALNNFINSLKTQRDTKGIGEDSASYEIDQPISQSPNLSILPKDTNDTTVENSS